MSKRVLFVHGAGEGAYEEDEPLAASLRYHLGADYEVHLLRMPTSYEATFAEWVAPIELALERTTEPVHLVGHSVGGSVLLKFLSERHVGAAAGLSVIAAPFWGADDFWTWEEARLPANAATKLAYLHGVFLYHAVDDEVVPHSHMAMYGALLPEAVTRTVESGGHQLGNDLGEVASDIARLGRTSFTLEYRLPAPAAQVWRYLTVPGLLERWYWPASLRPVYEMDAVAGGEFRFASEVAGMAVSGVYLEAAAPHRLVKSWRWDGGEEETRVHVALAETGNGGTLLSLTHSGHDSAESLENHRVGWTDCLDRLRALLDGSGGTVT